jgi:hypothetical protein
MTSKALISMENLNFYYKFNAVAIVHNIFVIFNLSILLKTTNNSDAKLKFPHSHESEFREQYLKANNYSTPPTVCLFPSDKLSNQTIKL